jgi:SAM-dependent methyltransferase
MNNGYRSAVGPADRYDVLGAHQFCVMVSLGLREQHKLLDLGCGSLRGGRLFIPYLAYGNYYGIEPHTDLVEEGLDHELGRSILGVKGPTWNDNADLDCAVFTRASGVTFDFVLAQSIFSHAYPQLIYGCLHTLREALKPTGAFIFTYFQGTSDYRGTTWARGPDAHYTPEWMHRVLKREGGFQHVHTLAFEHPSGQTWVEARFG